MRETWVSSLGLEYSWRREQLPTPVFWPGEFHGQRSLAGYSPWGRKALDTTAAFTISHINITKTIAGDRWHMATYSSTPGVNNLFL